MLRLSFVRGFEGFVCSEVETTSRDGLLCCVDGQGKWTVASADDANNYGGDDVSDDALAVS